MRVLVVDDHPLMANAVKLALYGMDKSAGVEIADDLAPAVRLARQLPGFDLCLLDLGLPEADGIEALLTFRAACPELPVVVLSGHDDRASILAALDAGAMGYIPKSSPVPVMINAIRLVMSGAVYVPPEALRARAGADDDPQSAPAHHDDSAATVSAQLGLSTRQTEVLELLLKGLPNKLIARRLEISDNTVKIHVSSVLRALGVSSRTQALLAAHKLGLRLRT